MPKNFQAQIILGCTIETEGAFHAANLLHDFIQNMTVTKGVVVNAISSSFIPRDVSPMEQLMGLGVGQAPAGDTDGNSIAGSIPPSQS